MKETNTMESEEKGKKALLSSLFPRKKKRKTKTQDYLPLKPKISRNFN